MRKIATVFAFTAVGLSLAVPAVNATNWGPISSSYNGSKVVSGSGSFTGGSVTSSASITVKDEKNDGNAVYGKTRYQYKWISAGGTTEWEQFGTTLSIPQFSNTTKSKSNSNLNEGPGLDTRGRSQVCAQMGFPVPDSCASTTTY